MTIERQKDIKLPFSVVTSWLIETVIQIESLKEIVNHLQSFKSRNGTCLKRWYYNIMMKGL